MMYGISTTSEITEHLDNGVVVAIGVSGGKDSHAVAIRLVEYLDSIGHRGPRVLVHADLGRVEWADSLPACERLADFLKMELMVVRRAAGDMMDRWETRWKNNLRRYINLECVKLILPWSTPGLRFCTSEMKTSVICSALSKRYPRQTILSVTGIRHAESANRAKMPTASKQPKLCRKGVTGYNWNPIIQWPTEDVYSFLAAKNERLHEAYCVYGCTRVSCSFCIMSSLPDLKNAARCESNHDIYRVMVDLEVRSTFAFQGSRWLADIAPHLLSAEKKEAVQQAKEAAALRVAAEARLPKHLLYTKGWPTSIPTMGEAELIASIRKAVGDALGISVRYTTAEGVRGRYAELLEQQGLKTELTPNARKRLTASGRSRLEKGKKLPVMLVEKSGQYRLFA